MGYIDKVAGIPGVYCIKNILDGRCYVGQTKDIGRRWRQHLNSQTLEVQQDIRKLGTENFQFQVLEEISDLKTRLSREKYWIEKLQAFENGYNSSKGGEGHYQSEEARKRMSEAHKGVPKSEEVRRRISESLKGVPKPEETRRRMVEASRRKAKNPEYLKKLSEAHKGLLKGVPKSEETRRRISESHKGITKSEETRRRMAESHKGVPKHKYRYLLPDGTIRTMCPHIAARKYTNRGIQITRLDNE